MSGDVHVRGFMSQPGVDREPVTIALGLAD